MQQYAQVQSRVPSTQKPNYSTAYWLYNCSWVLLGIKSIIDRIFLKAVLIIDALGSNSFRGYDRWSIIVGPTTHITNCHLTFWQMRHVDWEMILWLKVSQVFSDPSCKAFTRQLPLIHCTASLSFKNYILHYFAFLWNFMALNFFSSCSAIFSRNCCSQWGRKNGPCRKHKDFFLQFCYNFVFPLTTPIHFFLLKICTNLLWRTQRDLSKE